MVGYPEMTRGLPCAFLLRELLFSHGDTGLTGGKRTGPYFRGPPIHPVPQLQASRRGSVAPIPIDDLRAGHDTDALLAVRTVGI